MNPKVQKVVIYIMLFIMIFSALITIVAPLLSSK
ncbi:MAG: stressosome-associated protein Prli42 [Bacilli bacterium]|nr:stressosome-associated protein Prli42 [Bacilli bacterium]